MENTFLSELTYSALLWRIVGAVRRQAKSVPTTPLDGTIRISLKPLSRLADEWLGSLSDQSWMDGNEGDDVCECQYVFKLDPQGKHITSPSSRAIQSSDTTIMVDGAKFVQLAVSVCSDVVSDSDLTDCRWTGLREAQRVFERFGNRVQFDPRIEMTMVWL